MQNLKGLASLVFVTWFITMLSALFLEPKDFAIPINVRQVEQKDNELPEKLEPLSKTDKLLKRIDSLDTVVSRDLAKIKTGNRKVRVIKNRQPRGGSSIVNRIKNK